MSLNCSPKLTRTPKLSSPETDAGRERECDLATRRAIVLHVSADHRWPDGKSCFWCGATVVNMTGSLRRPPMRATKEHLITRLYRPRNTHTPLVTACADCNHSRGLSMEWLPRKPTEVARRFVREWAENWMLPPLERIEIRWTEAELLAGGGE